MEVRKLIRTLAFAFWFLMLVNGVRGQDNFVKVSFEIDGKRVEERFKILIYVDGMTIEPLRFENGFVVPAWIKKVEKVRVRFWFGKHNLLFEPVYIAKFETDWIVGIDNKPFDQENVDPQAGKELKVVYYIDFVPHDGDETRLVVKVPKEHKKTRAGRARLKSHLDRDWYDGSNPQAAPRASLVGIIYDGANMWVYQSWKRYAQQAGRER